MGIPAGKSRLAHAGALTITTPECPPTPRSARRMTASSVSRPISASPLVTRRA